MEIAKTIYLKKTFPSITKYRTINIDSLDDLKEAKKII